MAVNSYIQYKMMVGNRMHTYDGKLLSSLSGLEEVFDSYPMQKALGHAYFFYSFPSCFLVPFLLEPVFAIWLPYHISSLMVGSNPEMRGDRAEKAMAISAPFDLGRYADCLLNVLLCVMILFFPSGYFLVLLCAFIFSHTYIFLYDHYRVLRAVPGFSFASSVVDECVCFMMVLPCALIGVCIVVKSDAFASIGLSLLARCAGVFLCHCLVHTLLLVYCVPFLGQSCNSSQSIDTTYAETAEKTPQTWFTMNPVHCLRSKYICKHRPPCLFAVRGKEHIMVPNPREGMFFDGKALAETEAYPSLWEYLSCSTQRAVS
jgi:hypothetical protein